MHTESGGGESTRGGRGEGKDMQREGHVHSEREYKGEVREGGEIYQAMIEMGMYREREY